jgi:hypothetical protein
LWPVLEARTLIARRAGEGRPTPAVAGSTAEAHRSLLLAIPLLAVAGYVSLPAADPPPPAPTEAPASFQLVTNGFTTQADFLEALDDFSQDATPDPGDEGGLGPTFNGTSCKACHLNPATGGGLSRFELRAGRLDVTGAFVAPAGGTLIRQLATDPAAQQRVPDGFFVTKRRSTSLFGLGYVEVIRDVDILAVRDAQDPALRGVATLVPATTGITPDGDAHPGKPRWAGSGGRPSRPRSSTSPPTPRSTRRASRRRSSPTSRSPWTGGRSPSSSGRPTPKTRRPRTARSATTSPPTRGS